MKTLLIMIMLGTCVFEAHASCLVRIEKGNEYKVSVWKHSEDLTEDQVVVNDYSSMDLLEIRNMLSSPITLVFNKGVFVSMKHDDGQTKRWAALSKPEKDLIEFVQKKFNVEDKK